MSQDVASQIQNLFDSNPANGSSAPIAMPAPGYALDRPGPPDGDAGGADDPRPPYAMIAGMFADMESTLPRGDVPFDDLADFLGDSALTPRDGLADEMRRIGGAAEVAHVVYATSVGEADATRDATLAGIERDARSARSQIDQWLSQIQSQEQIASSKVSSKGYPDLAHFFNGRTATNATTTGTQASVTNDISSVVSGVSGLDSLQAATMLPNPMPFTVGGAIAGGILGAIIGGWTGFFIVGVLGAVGGFLLGYKVRDGAREGKAEQVGHVSAATQRARASVQHYDNDSSNGFRVRRESAAVAHATALAQAGARRDEWTTVLAPQLEQFDQRVRSAIASWESPDWATWSSPAAMEPLTQAGVAYVMLDEVRQLPVVVSLPDQMSLLFHSWGAKQAHVSEAILMRYLTSVPAGKLEFTLIDPVGLGRNVALLMHLHDHRPELINDRAWIEPSHIEQQLAELSEQMQNIIQKYLRTTYATMEEYNAAAGVVAEPYRVLVVNNFPTNFTPDALRHLVSIVANGPKCGVHTVIAVDDSQEKPYGFNMADLERECLVFRQPRLQGSNPGDAPVGLGWSMRVPGMNRWMFLQEDPPEIELSHKVLDAVGKQAVVNSVVQVPFAGIAPAEAEWWAGSTRDGLTAALGVTGARKPQLLEFGKGTAQTALVVGRVGSGKSTLLHTAIMNLALAYSPEELELYLLDFKKGVEFKTYAVHKLPHARAIAVESEREFALSVLQKLDRELDERGRLFRSVTESHGEAPNIQSYRGKTGRPLSRIVLLVDEFQEFFTESDTLASQAGLLLDRLVRQGRAFGIHVILGSQSLAGAYTLAKSTLDQMAVRIALQCSDADSRLILSDDNPAARLLSRPGEAIYNDENGRIEGNDLFQTAWLTDDDRDAYLDRLAALAAERYPDLPEPVVFEGNVAADPSRNRQLGALLAANRPTKRAPAVNAWLGDPIAIAEPTAAVLRDQAGCNLIVLGQDEAAGYGMLATALIGIARQHELSGEDACLHVIDMSSADHPQADLFARVGALFPNLIEISGRRSVLSVVGKVHAELERRMAAEDSAVLDRRYLVVIGLNRARDLREDDDGGRYDPFADEPAATSPNRQFLKILKEGPDFGIHTLAWADTLNNLSRVVDRRGMREFDLRVAMQMSAEDSNTVVDSPAASRLGPNRALLYSEEKGTADKFRPYGIPESDWVERLRKRPAPPA